MLCKLNFLKQVLGQMYENYFENPQTSWISLNT